MVYTTLLRRHCNSRNSMPVSSSVKLATPIFGKWDMSSTALSMLLRIFWAARCPNSTATYAAVAANSVAALLDHLTFIRPLQLLCQPSSLLLHGKAFARVPRLCLSSVPAKLPSFPHEYAVPAYPTTRLPDGLASGKISELFHSVGGKSPTMHPLWIFLETQRLLP